MGNYTREEILAMAEEEDVEFIRLQFTDMFGTLKNIAITARELPRALDNQCVVYCSHIAGIVGEKEPDLILYPDYDTFSILPWRPQQGKVARLICDMRRADGSEHEMSSRYILKKTAQAAEKAGYTCYSLFWMIYPDFLSKDLSTKKIRQLPQSDKICRACMLFFCPKG